MSHYCGSCFIKKAIKTGEKVVRLIVCIGISMIKNEDKLAKNPRIGMMYNYEKCNPKLKLPC
jgi:deoxyribodipyrimidine photolyase-related protein